MDEIQKVNIEEAEHSVVKQDNQIMHYRPSAYASLHRKIVEIKNEIGVFFKDKTATTPKFQYKYVSLEQILEKLLPLLQKYQVDIIIETALHPELSKQMESVWCVSNVILIDLDTGDYEQKAFTFPMDKLATDNKIQSWGSTQSYAKRYIYTNIFDIAQTDRTLEDMLMEEEDHKWFWAHFAPNLFNVCKDQNQILKAIQGYTSGKVSKETLITTYGDPLHG
jgi:hypothetical protein